MPLDFEGAGRAKLGPWAAWPFSRLPGARLCVGTASLALSWKDGTHVRTALPFGLASRLLCEARSSSPGLLRDVGQVVRYGRHADSCGVAHAGAFKSDS